MGDNQPTQRLENSPLGQTGGGTALAFWLFVLAWNARVTIFLRARSVGEFSSVDASAAAQILIVLVTLAALVVTGRAVAAWGSLRGSSLRILVGYYVLCALSAVWSALPQYTIYRAVEVMAMFLAIQAALSSISDFERAEKQALSMVFLAMVFDMVIIVKIYGLSTRLWDWHTNAYSASAAMLFCYCLGEYFQADGKRKKLLKWLGLFGLGGVILGTSSASNVSVLLGVIVILFFKRKYGLVAFLGLVFILIQLFGAELSDFMGVIFPGKSAEQIASMRGRMDMWTNYLEFGMKAPIFGHGYAVTATESGAVFYTRPHNSLMAAFLGTGVVGLFVVLIFGFKLLGEILRANRAKLPGAVGGAAAISAGLLNSLSHPLVLEEWKVTASAFACMAGFFVLHVARKTRTQSPGTQL